MKQKLLSKVMLLLFALVAGMGSAWADEVTLTAGTNGSACKVNDVDGIKIGTSSKGGDMTITVPANTTKLTLHAAAWKGVTGLSLNISGATTDPTSIALTADAGVTSNSPFTLSGTESDYEFEIALSDITAETELTFETSASKRCVVWGASATVSSGGGSQTETCATPTFSPTAGTYTSAQNVTLSTTTDGATIYYTTDGSAPTTSSSVYSSAIPVSATTTIKAIAAKDGNNNSSVASATYLILGHAGTEQDPYTVADARAAIDANTGITGVYVSGIISQVDSYSSNQITYWISEDGTTTDQFEVYKGKGLNNTNFTAVTDVVVGAEVVVYGDIKKYNTTYEFNSGNYLTSYTAPTTPTIATSTSTLSGFTYETGNGPSTEKTFTVSGISLTAGIALSLGENSNFEISTTSGSGFGSSVNLASDASDETVYVRLKSGLAVGSYDGTVTLTSTGATDVTVSLSGSVTAPEAVHYTWDLSTDQTATATDEEMTWTSTYASMEAAKSSASTATNNYYPGTPNQSYTSTRFYKNGTLTITPASGYAITSVVFEATTSSYATALKNSTWTNASATVDGTTVTVTPTNGASAFSATIGGTCGFTEVKVYYVEDNTPAIAVDPTAIDANCPETEGTITVTYTNIADNSSAAVYFCDSEGESASYDWITATINASKNVAYTINANSNTTERTAYMKVKVGDVYSPLITITQAAYVEAAYYLATSITSGKHYVIASGTSGAVSVMKAQNTNNRTVVAGTVSGTGLSFEDGTEPTEVVIYGPDASGKYTIYDASYTENEVVVGGYLYAAGGTSNNYLKTETALDNNNNGIWSISIGADSKVATIKSQGTDVTRNWLRYNSSSTLFSCYASGQSDVYLYEKANEATPTESITIGSTGYATYCSNNALDFSGTGITAYMAKASGTSVTLTEIADGIVPAREGVVLMGTTSSVPAATSAASDYNAAENEMVGVTTRTQVDATDGGKYNYILSNETAGVGFYAATDGKFLAANKAYLSTTVDPTSLVKAFLGFSEGDSDGIKSIDNSQFTIDNAVFDLSGRRVSKAVKGIYIVNGKKVVK